MREANGPRRRRVREGEEMGVKKSLLKKAARLLIKLGVSPWFRIRQPGFILRYYPSSMSRILWVDQHLGRMSYADDQRFFRRYLRAGDVVVDVGANIGFFTMISSLAVGESGKVTAVEAHPRTFEYLRGNVTLNKARNVRLFNVALGDEERTVRFSDKKSDDRNAIVDDESGLAVPMKRLDGLGVDDAELALLKIDVEGYEKFVIEGGRDLLKRVRCVYFEVVEKHFAQFGYTGEDLLRLIVDQGFEILEIQGEAVRRVSPENPAVSSKNLAAVRDLDDFLGRTGLQLTRNDT